MVSDKTALLTALVVDDFEDARHMLKHVLEEKAYRVLDAGIGTASVYSFSHPI